MIYSSNAAAVEDKQDTKKSIKKPASTQKSSNHSEDSVKRTSSSSEMIGSKNSVYVSGGINMIQSMSRYDMGFNVGVGKNIGSIKSVLNLDWSGDISVEGLYAKASGSSLGISRSISQIGAYALYAHPIPYDTKLMLTAGLGIGQQNESFGGFLPAEFSSTGIIGSIGAKYRATPQLDISTKYWLWGFNGIHIDASYRF